MDHVTGAESGGQTRPALSARQELLGASARRARRCSTILIVVSTVICVGAFIGNWITSFDNDPRFSDPDAPFKYQLAQFGQNLGFAVALPLIVLAIGFLLRMQADRMAADAEQPTSTDSMVPPEDVLTVDFSHPAPPVLPRQSSPDDSVWRPPDSEAADNPFHRS